MGRRKVNKEDLLKVGLLMVWDKGFHGVSVKQITQAADVLVGSFYNYFKSKEEFVLALLDFYWEGWEQILKASLGAEGLDAKQKFEKLFDDGLKRFKAKKYTQGCFCGMMAHEMSDRNELFEKKTEQIFKKAVGFYLQAIQQGISEGTIDKNIDAQAIAEFILNAYEGALLRMKSAKSKRPVELCKDFSLKLLFE